MANCNAMVSGRPSIIFSGKHLEQDLAKLLRSGSVEQHRDVLERPLAASALAGEVSQFHVLLCSSRVLYSLLVLGCLGSLTSNFVSMFQHL